MNTLLPSPKRLWLGRVLGGLPVLFLAFDGAIKLAEIAPVRDAFQRLGYPESSAVAIGALELACTLAYALPRTAVLGALLLTAFLGGATTTHVRVGDPFYFPILVGLLLWGGLVLREPRLGALVPLRARA